MTNSPIYLRFRDLKDRGLVRNRTTLGRWIRDRGFPPGTMIGLNTRVWTAEEIDKWVDKQRQSEAA